MPENRKRRIPVAVLERARKVSAAPPRPPDPPKTATRTKLPREKIVEALRKLHPMD